VVTGDLALILEYVMNDCLGHWSDEHKSWEIPASHLHVLAEVCENCGFQLHEVSVPASAAPEKPAAGSAVRGSPQHEPEAQALSPSVSPKTASEPTPAAGDHKEERNRANFASVVVGRVEKVTVGMTGKNAPTRQLKLAGEVGHIWYSCYSQSLFEFIDRKEFLTPKGVEFYVDARKTIVGFKRIGDRQFDTDGRTPIVGVNEERKRTGELKFEFES
jgi:hypothetical protein